MAEKIMTLHPAGKAGVNIDKQKYDTVRGAILQSLQEHGTLTFGDLTAEVRRRLEGTFTGSISWYVTTVKLDLEARREIARVPKSSPQRLIIL
ncbi:MAG: hypothetical protein OXK81_06955 [Chloroflexota bacterium]|nr:hypothetical protein [Chloroflexota bacterium]MDE2929448.1 hypothetical protein [Chloroflexota bacterium]